MMQWMMANPGMLWLLPMAAVPIAFHLFLRIRKRRHPFSSLMFFVAADPRLRSRRRIREWLALLLRALAIALLVLALSRPVWTGGGSGAAARVLVIDNSGSMSATDRDGRSRLHQALEAACAMVLASGTGDLTAVVPLVDDPTLALPEGLSRDREALRSAVSRIRPTQASGSPGRALNRAAAMLSPHAGRSCEVHVFTDLQTVEWGVNRDGDAPRRTAGTRVHVHRVAGGRLAPNVAVGQWRTPGRLTVAGRRYEAGITLRNTSDVDASVVLRTSDDAGVDAMQSVDVPAHATVRAPVAFGRDTAGDGWVHAWVEGDAFDADNDLWAAYRAMARQTVVLASESASEFGLLPVALAPAADGMLSGLSVECRSPADADALVKGAPALVVLSWRDVAGDAGGAVLRAYVAAGGRVLVAPRVGEAAAADTSGPYPQWLGATPADDVAAPRGVPLAVFDPASAIWLDARDEKGDVPLRRVRLFAGRTLALGSGVSAVLSLADGRPVLSCTAIGRGYAFCSGMGFDRAASTLPLTGVFLALAQGMALQAPPSDGGADVVQVEAGDPSTGTWPAADEGESRLRVVTVAGDPLEWQGTTDGFAGFPRGGVYAVSSGDTVRRVAVRSAEQEGTDDVVRGSRVPALAGMPHDVTDYRDRDTWLASVRRRTRGASLYPLLLLGALAAAAAESLVVNPPMRRAAAGPVGVKGSV